MFKKLHGYSWLYDKRNDVSSVEIAHISVLLIFFWVGLANFLCRINSFTLSCITNFSCVKIAQYRATIAQCWTKKKKKKITAVDKNFPALRRNRLSIQNTRHLHWSPTEWFRVFCFAGRKLAISYYYALKTMKCGVHVTPEAVVVVTTLCVLEAVPY